jgi:type II secretion system protein G
MLDDGPKVWQIFGFLSERRSVRSLLLSILIVGSVFAIALLGRHDEPKPRTVNAILDASEELDVLRIAIELYYRDTGHYPDTQEGLPTLLSPGTNDLKSGWAGPYITKLHGDPWRRRYEYHLQTNGVPFLCSLGADGLPGTEDDIFPHPLAELKIPSK